MDFLVASVHCSSALCCCVLPPKDQQHKSSHTKQEPSRNLQRASSTHRKNYIGQDVGFARRRGPPPFPRTPHPPLQHITTGGWHMDCVGVCGGVGGYLYMCLCVCVRGCGRAWCSPCGGWYVLLPMSRCSVACIATRFWALNISWRLGTGTCTIQRRVWGGGGVSRARPCFS